MNKKIDLTHKAMTAMKEMIEGAAPATQKRLVKQIPVRWLATMVTEHQSNPDWTDEELTEHIDATEKEMRKSREAREFVLASWIGTRFLGEREQTAKGKIYNWLKNYKGNSPYLFIGGIYQGKVGSTLTMKKAAERIIEIDNRHNLWVKAQLCAQKEFGNPVSLTEEI